MYLCNRHLFETNIKIKNGKKEFVRRLDRLTFSKRCIETTTVMLIVVKLQDLNHVVINM